MPRAERHSRRCHAKNAQPVRLGSADLQSCRSPQPSRCREPSGTFGAATPRAHNLSASARRTYNRAAVRTPVGAASRAAHSALPRQGRITVRLGSADLQSCRSPQPSRCREPSGTFGAATPRTHNLVRLGSADLQSCRSPQPSRCREPSGTFGAATPRALNLSASARRTYFASAATSASSIPLSELPPHTLVPERSYRMYVGMASTSIMRKVWPAP